MRLDPSIPASFFAETLSHFAITAMRPMSGGLSGAKVWRCNSSLHGSLCLRKWSATHPTPARLQFIHAAMENAHERLAFIPRLHRDWLGASFWTVDDCLWEVTQWMPGEANYLARPTQEKLGSAVDAIADLHATWSEYSHEQSISPSVQQRVTMLGDWLLKRDLVEHVGAQVRGPIEAAACMSTVQMLQCRGPLLLNELQLVADEQVRLHPVLRDVWSDHLLFEDNCVSGVVDFGAVRMDEPATDVARMLGSLHPFESDVRSAAVERYNARCTQEPVSFARVDLLDRSATLLTALQWLQWLVLERRKFPMDTAKLMDRWQTALARMMGEEL